MNWDCTSLAEIFGLGLLILARYYQIDDVTLYVSYVAHMLIRNVDVHSPHAQAFA